MLKQVSNGVQSASMDDYAGYRAIAKDATIQPALLSKAGQDWHVRQRNRYAIPKPSVACPNQGNEPPAIASPRTTTPPASNLRELLPNPAYTGQFRAFRRSLRGQPTGEIDCRSYPVGRWKGLNSK